MITLEGGAPNLDCVTTDPIEMYRLAHHLKLLALYANSKAAAMTCRHAGDTVVALHFEKLCDQTYQKLPLEWRW